MCWFFYAREIGLTASTEPHYAIPRDLQGSYLGSDQDVLFGARDFAAARAFMRLQRTHGELRTAVLFARDGQRVVLTHARVWSSEHPNASGVQSEHLIAPDVRTLPVDLYRELPAADRALSELRIRRILERCAR